MNARVSILKNVLKQCKKGMVSGSDDEFTAILKGAKKEVKKDALKEDATPEEKPKAKKQATPSAKQFLDFIKDKVETGGGKTVIYKDKQDAKPAPKTQKPVVRGAAPEKA